MTLRKGMKVRFVAAAEGLHSVYYNPPVAGSVGVITKVCPVTPGGRRWVEVFWTSGVNIAVLAEEIVKI